MPTWHAAFGTRNGRGVPFPLEIDYGGQRPRGAPRFYSFEEAAELLKGSPEGAVEVVEHLGRHGVRGLLTLLEHLPGFDPDLVREQAAAEAYRRMVGSQYGRRE
jgi:hypothetical protein